ncbi:MAG: NUDIX domain-containing protein [Clostridia bacterium]|nr:NUDIX domain-containing protein [Clostridia bacterium]
MEKRIVPFTESPAWPILAELTDKNVLGTDGLCNALPRKTARAILKRDDGLFAVMYAERFNLYSLPGGGIEGDETPEDAIIREIWEETGCTCATIEPLGVVLENRFHADYTQIDFYFVVTTNAESGQLHLTPNEEQNGTHPQWHTLDDVVRLIRDREHDTNQRKYLQARDVTALHAYLQR